MTDTIMQMSPMMRQYWEIKARYPDKDTILFFRLGDFYEMFFDDAEVASKILDIALTSRNRNDEKQVPLCGIPFHAADSYINKLLENGKKVAICEQIEDPAEAKGIVKRDVIRVITPGTITEPDTLEPRRNNFLAALSRCQAPVDNSIGLAVVDITTGLFRAAEFEDTKALKNELARIEPAEILISCSSAGADQFDTGAAFGTLQTILDDSQFDAAALEKVVGEEESAKVPASAKAAAGAICNYIRYSSKEVLSHIRGVEVYESARYMVIDEGTKRNLELTRTMIDGTSYGSLLWLLDQTITPMGGRLMREWLFHPLTDEAGINERLDAVERLHNDIILSEGITKVLKDVADIERGAGRIAMETANARDLIALKNSLKVLPQLTDIMRDVGGMLSEGLRTPHDDMVEVAEKIEGALIDEPPLGLKDGGLIREGFSGDLDGLRKISREGKSYIGGLEAEERKRTGITSLKVRYNRVFGYYIEVTNVHREKVPQDYIRKQTLANAERYITPELKAFEEEVLGAEEKIRALEYEIFSGLRLDLTAYVPRIKEIASLIARLDALLSLAIVARKNRYVRPDICKSDEISIEEGRHPIIERINTADRFVPNDIYLNNTTDRLLIITGPNMAGKSTVMRQVALIVLMAQMGGFVPAIKAKMGVVDRIFTRVGASDNIMRGQSTFMVEMQEAASILSQATKRSLIIIDEIGRGTSTFDGLAIAWAVAEYIHDEVGAKTLFATHYHELTDLDLTKKGAKNFNIAVREWRDRIIFLHKLVPGGVSHSYGIQVAQLAGLPKDVIERAREVLANLEKGELDEVGQPKIAYSKSEKSKKRFFDENQMKLFRL